MLTNEALIPTRTRKTEEARPVDLETLLLLYFDIEELAKLTPGEIRLLQTTARDQAPEPAEDDKPCDILEDYLTRIRTSLTRHRALSASQGEEQLDITDKRSKREGLR